MEQQQENKITFWDWLEITLITCFVFSLGFITGHKLWPKVEVKNEKELVDVKVTTEVCETVDNSHLPYFLIKIK